MLMKFLHKFFSRADIPWVNLVWENYYSNGQLPRQRVRFWWRDVVKLLDTYKGMTKITVGDGKFVFLWKDLWNGQAKNQMWPELFSFVRNPWITIQQFTLTDSSNELFHLPLSGQAYQQLQVLLAEIPDQLQPDRDVWSYTWGNPNFSTAKAYSVMIGHRPTHPAFRWLWQSKCQMKYRVFFWLLLRDRLSTRDLLSRK